MSNYFSKGLKRSTLTVALGLCFAGGVYAQSSVGSIFGDTSANAAVTIENLDNGAPARSIQTGPVISRSRSLPRAAIA